jgi:HPt (histidine-containing phosphotransfer) domain-containing protein
MPDLTFLKQFTKGDTQKMARYITMYLQTAPATMQQMASSLRTQDWEQLRIQAHSLKPQADFMGLKNLKSTLVKIETAVGEEAYDTLPRLCQQAARLHQQSASQLRAELEGL